jgi:hypothetical protein
MCGLGLLEPFSYPGGSQPEKSVHTDTERLSDKQAHNPDATAPEAQVPLIFRYVSQFEFNLLL